MTFTASALSRSFEPAATQMIDRAVARARRGKRSDPPWVPGLIESPPGDPVENRPPPGRPAERPAEPAPYVGRHRREYAGRHRAPEIGSAAREATASPYEGRRRLAVVPPVAGPGVPLTLHEREFQRALYRDQRIHKPRKSGRGEWSLEIEWGERVGRVRSVKIRVWSDTSAARKVRKDYTTANSYIKNPDLRSTAALDRVERGT